MSSRLRSISRPMMYSSLRSTTFAASLRLLFLQLPLPVEHARPGALRLGLGDHARRLIEARQAGVGEHVVGHELAEPLPRLDRLLVPTELVVRHGEPVPGVDVAGVEGERLLVPGDRLLELAVAEEIDGGVVEVLLVRHVGSVPHSRWHGQGTGARAAREVSQIQPCEGTGQRRLAGGPPEAVFVASGTANRAARGRHLVPHLALYRCSALASFARFVLPDGVRLPCLAFVPPPALRPASSLVQMCVWVGEALASSI